MSLAVAGRLWLVQSPQESLKVAVKPVVSQNSIVVSVHHSAKSGELSSDG